MSGIEHGWTTAESPDSSDVTSANMNTHIVSPGGCMGQRTSSYSVTTNPEMIPVNGTDVFDPDGYHDPTTDNTKFIIPTGKGGRLFLCGASVENSNASGNLRIYVNTVAIVAGGNAVQFMNLISSVIYLVDGDEVEFGAVALNGHNLIVTDYPMYFYVVPVG